MLYCYGEFCSKDYNEVCDYIAENAIYVGEEGLLLIIENEIYELESEEES